MQIKFSNAKVPLMGDGLCSEIRRAGIPLKKLYCRRGPSLMREILFLIQCHARCDSLIHLLVLNFRPSIPLVKVGLPSQHGHRTNWSHVSDWQIWRAWKSPVHTLLLGYTSLCLTGNNKMGQLGQKGPMTCA